MMNMMLHNTDAYTILKAAIITTTTISAVAFPDQHCYRIFLAGHSQQIA
jgi:hypothetical protein